MRRFLIISMLLAVTAAANGQQAVRTLVPSDYLFPVLNVSGLCSANFGEMRPDHFHSGVDIKTDGVEGKPIVAIADGYISRITVTPSGYGRALYIVHPDGTTSVYGHLSRFRDDIDSLVDARRNRYRLNRADIKCTPQMFPVKQGEPIGLSGNTGNSFGPHLHLEIRDTHTNTTLNLMKQGVIRVPDDIPPAIRAIHYVAVDSAGIIPVRTAPRRIAVKQTSPGRYRTEQPVNVAPAGYFIIETLDRKNSVANRFGVWRVTEKVDGRTLFEYRADGFGLDDSRYCNAVAYYPMQISANCEVITLAAAEGCPERMYNSPHTGGIITAEAGSRHSVSISVEDEFGNRSVLDFDIAATLDGPEKPEIPDSAVIDRRKPFEASVGEISVSIPELALYESARFECRRSQRKAPEKRTVDILTPLYDVMDSEIPLHKPAEIAIKAYVPVSLRPRAAMALLSKKGRLTYAGGRYEDGKIIVSTRKFGTFCVVTDTVAPSVRPHFAQHSDMSGRKSVSFSISFSISDNFSGIREYSATIDGKWVALDYSPIKGTVSHTFDHRRYARNTDHILVLKVTDNCGNTTEKGFRFFR